MSKLRSSLVWKNYFSMFWMHVLWFEAPNHRKIKKCMNHGKFHSRLMSIRLLWHCQRGCKVNYSKYFTFLSLLSGLCFLKTHPGKTRPVRDFEEKSDQKEWWNGPKQLLISTSSSDRKPCKCMVFSKLKITIFIIRRSSKNTSVRVLEVWKIDAGGRAVGKFFGIFIFFCTLPCI